MVQLTETQTDTAVDLSIVIVSFNTREVTRRCLRHVQTHAAGLRYEVLVADNASADGSAEMVSEEFPSVKLIRLDCNRGFAGGNNPALKKAVGRYLLLLNSDAFLTPRVLEDTIAYMESHSEIGVLGCKLVSENGSMQPSARMLPGPLNKIFHITGLAAMFPASRIFGRVDYTWWDHSVPKSVGWVVGAYFLIRREAFNDIGLLDERYFLYFEEIDYCLTARKAGWDVVFYPYARVVHLGGQSSVRTGQRVSAKGRQMVAIRITSEFRFYRKHYGRYRVLLVAGIEAIWNAVVYARNSIPRSREAKEKKREAGMMIGLIVHTLMEDRCGGGRSRQMFANLRQDLQTYKGDWSRQGFWAMVVYRFGRWRYTIRSPLVRKPFSLLYKILYKFIQIITGIELPCEVVVGKNFRIDHFGGIIVSGFASFGDNCVIRDGVTIGLRRVDDPVAPKIGHNVDIGTGAKVLGDIAIGDNVVIGANAVVLEDVPSNSIAVGVPARIKSREKHEGDLT